MSGQCGRKHTPIVSERQRRLFGLWLSKPSRRPSSISASEVRRHLKEAKGKDLPERRKKS